MSAPKLPILALALLPLLALPGCGDDSAASATDAAHDHDAAVGDGDLGPATDAAELPDAEPLPTEAPAGQAAPLNLQEIPGLSFRLSVLKGGGTVTPAEVTVGGDGQLNFDWILGPAPVDNTLRIEPVDGGVGGIREITLRGTVAEPAEPERFGDVHGWLTEAGREGSTEDLTFRGEALLVGITGGLLTVSPEGTVNEVALTGEPIDHTLGFAAAANGVLWVVDNGANKVLRIGLDNVVEVAMTTNGTTPLQGPNYIAIGHDGRIYLSDPCAGEIVRFDPVTEEYATHAFDLPTEGGPNGMAVGPDGALYVATENTGLLCSHASITPTDEIAGVFRLDLTDFTTRTPVAEHIGLFGDGLAFDAEGNLYVVVDTAEGLRLNASEIRVIPAGTQENHPFVRAATRQLIANVAFGQGAYGPTTLYMAMLHISPFTDLAARGLTRVQVGIPGLPLLP